MGEEELRPFSWPHPFPYEERLRCAIPFPERCGSAPPVSKVGKQKALANSAFQAISGVDRFYDHLLACNAKPPSGNRKDNSCETETRFPPTTDKKVISVQTTRVYFFPPAQFKSLNQDSAFFEDPCVLQQRECYVVTSTSHYLPTN